MLCKPARVFGRWPRSNPPRSLFSGCVSMHDAAHRTRIARIFQNYYLYTRPYGAADKAVCPGNFDRLISTRTLADTLHHYPHQSENKVLQSDGSHIQRWKSREFEKLNGSGARKEPRSVMHSGLKRAESLSLMHCVNFVISHADQAKIPGNESSFKTFNGQTHIIFKRPWATSWPPS